ncbi:MAG: gamma-glutamylcyclotransferase [Cyanobacteria bacterium QS_8_64_29]|nr:MAG: gamma-glutamylcyclotransferase [Cyanobacteria bacterium QS_8_64_29]
MTQAASAPEGSFYYFAYGSCMCPVDLKRSLGERVHLYLVGPAALAGYRLGFYHYSASRDCGVLDVVPDAGATVNGVLYCLPWHLSEGLDRREEVPTNGYRRETVSVRCNGTRYTGVRTYTVVNKTSEEIPPNDWYCQVVLRGAATCGLPEHYYWYLFDRMHQWQARREALARPA